jgi:hypothetical protein
MAAFAIVDASFKIRVVELDFVIWAFEAGIDWCGWDSMSEGCEEGREDACDGAHICRIYLSLIGEIK